MSSIRMADRVNVLTFTGYLYKGDNLVEVKNGLTEADVAILKKAAKLPFVVLFSPTEPDTE